MRKFQLFAPKCSALIFMIFLRMKSWVIGMHTHTFNYRPPTKLRKGNIFSCVCSSFCPQGDPMWPLPMLHWTSPYRNPSACPHAHFQTWDMEPHCIVTHPPPPDPASLDMGPCCTRILVTSGGQDWIPVQTCPPEDPPSRDIWWSRPETFSNLIT